MMNKYGKFFTVGTFAAAMGILEAVVVVYLRQIYYPSGFDFPLVRIPGRMLAVELIRELVTLVMLVSVGMLAGRDRLRKFAYFIFAFGVWDILYYIGLKAFLDWPPSLLTWDILFLIPITWLGPVLAPVICALTMILLSICLAAPRENGHEVRTGPFQWWLVLSGAFIIFCTFILDHAKLMVQNDLLSGFFTLAGNEKFWQISSQYVPARYNWYLFGLGEILILTAIAMLLRKQHTGAGR